MMIFTDTITFPMNKAKQTGDNEGMMSVIEMGIKEYCGTIFQTICRSNY